MKKNIFVIKKMTGQDWAKLLEITFMEIEAGFPSLDSFNNDLIDRETFLLRASNCALCEPLEKSRRSVSDFKHKLFNSK